MISVATFSLHKEPEFTTLTVWPLNPCNLRQLLAVNYRQKCCFIAIRNREWGDGFHPPDARRGKCSAFGRGVVGVIRAKNRSKAIFESSRLDDIVDLKVYIPSRRIRLSRQTIRDMESAFVTGRPELALNRWGGLWLYEHDACKCYVDVRSKDRDICRILSYILCIQGGVQSSDVATRVFRSLKRLDDTKCLLVQWDGAYCEYGAIDKGIQETERYDLVGSALKTLSEVRS